MVKVHKAQSDHKSCLFRAREQTGVLLLPGTVIKKAQLDVGSLSNSLWWVSKNHLRYSISTPTWGRGPSRRALTHTIIFFFSPPPLKTDWHQVIGYPFSSFWTHWWQNGESVSAPLVVFRSTCVSWERGAPLPARHIQRACQLASSAHLQLCWGTVLTLLTLTCS